MPTAAEQTRFGRTKNRLAAAFNMINMNKNILCALFVRQGSEWIIAFVVIDAKWPIIFRCP